jgi:hypothetical protein
VNTDRNGQGAVRWLLGALIFGAVAALAAVFYGVTR